MTTTKNTHQVTEKILTGSEVLDLVLRLGINYSTHESDLYIPVNEVTSALVNMYVDKQNVTIFRDSNTGSPWFEIPFAVSGEKAKDTQLSASINTEVKQEQKQNITFRKGKYCLTSDFLNLVISTWGLTKEQIDLLIDNSNKIANDLVWTEISLYSELESQYLEKLDKEIDNLSPEELKELLDSSEAFYEVFDEVSTEYESQIINDFITEEASNFIC